eukprot:Gregarina_sp_Poly_1__6839@NODE_36_length_18572_cov_139_626047_g31_i0_p7_GENE_NODE_36_length_18572_cov_139_626047_g31_i0NODE_36_length_18572_cov_139_626047_g31_i0_p7_ORF_typecomplete_len172_score16_19PATR/PF12951_7/0_43PATR/PF12951_7/1_5e03_NODE_36_length_18572_cov_139_626047_g31_i073588
MNFVKSALLLASLANAHFVSEEYTLTCSGLWQLTGASSATGNTDLARAFIGLGIQMYIAPNGFSTGLKSDAIITLSLGDSVSVPAHVFNDCVGEIELRGPPIIRSRFDSVAPLPRDGVVALADQYLYNFLSNLSSWRYSSVPGARPMLTLHATTTSSLTGIVDVALQFTKI